MSFGTNGQIWSNSMIPYEIDSGDYPIGSADRTAIEDAITEWNENTVMRLIPRLDEPDFIVFEDTGTRCASSVGRVGGRQGLTCNLEGNFTSGNLIHEIGHAVGLNHEQQRPDRNGFVNVTDTSDTTNCAIITGDRMLTDYDCGSIMHYGTGGCGGISPIRSDCTGLGQRTRLSGFDVWGVSLLYNIPMQTAVVWEDDSDDNNFFQIHASGFSENGKRCAGPLTINRRAAGQQRTPALGMAGNRDMVFVWADDQDNNGFYQIKMRGYNTNGRQLFSERTVNTESAGQQINPHVAVANDGRFVVIWQDDADKNGIYQIRARGFEPNGVERFAEFTVNSVAEGQQTRPRVAIAPDGFFVVVWEDDRDRNGFYNIHMRGFNPDGSQRWSQRRVNRRTAGQQRRPQIAMGPWGDFVVVWEDDTDNNDFYQIRMRAYAPDGGQKFSERTVNVSSAGQQLEPYVAVDDSFQLVVVWSDDRDKNGFYQIRMRGFNSDGSQRFSERTVNTDEDGQQRRASIAMQANGRFLVAWEDDKDSNGQAEILVRGFRANGTELYTTRQVSNRLGGHKGLPIVAAPAMNSFDPFIPFTTMGG